MFKADGKFFRIVSKVTDLVVLNILYIVCCILIITIGPATTALMSVTGQMVKGEEGYIVRSFFKKFKENFKQSTVMGIILLIIGTVLYYDLRIANVAFGAGTRDFVKGAVLVGMIVTVYVFLYAMALQAKFVNSIKNTLKNAILMGIANFPWTILILVITLSPLIVLLILKKIYMAEILFILLLYFSLIAYINSMIFANIFKKHIEK